MDMIKSIGICIRDGGKNIGTTIKDVIRIAGLPLLKRCVLNNVKDNVASTFNRRMGNVTRS